MTRTVMDPVHVTTSSSLLTKSNIAYALVCFCFIYTLYGVVWRLYLTPIAHIPGPLLARLTFWNEFYYDVVLSGKYTFKIKEYHDKYDPVIRINPYEVHIQDSEFYEQLYVGSSKGKVNKWWWAMRMFGQYDESAFDTLDHDKHRMRREAWNPYFSKASVSKLQPLLIQASVNKLCDRLSEYQAEGKTVVMTHAYACLTADVISEYSFPKSYGFLDWYPGFKFNGDHYNVWMTLSKMSHTLKQFGWLFPILNALPVWYLKMAAIEFYYLHREHQVLLRQMTEIKERLEHEKDSSSKETTGRPSMLEMFYTSTSLPPDQKSVERIKAESVTVVGAGTLTSTHALKTATYHLLANPAILDRFLNELESAIPDLANYPPDLRKLESIDYLVAVLYETLRLFYGVSHRLQRVFPDRTLVYGKGTAHEITIPPNTPVGMTSVHLHDDEKIFPDHRRFDPERWLPLQTNGIRLQKYLVPFGKGSRQCVGMELGKAEILTALANVFLRFGRSMRLVDCVRERDIDLAHDYFNPSASKGNNGLVVAFDAS